MEKSGENEQNLNEKNQGKSGIFYPEYWGQPGLEIGVQITC